jgi:hypothetical protein
MMQEPKRPVALEDLLRLKRAERPPAEFWERFDRELRAKQLAALVNKRPWWQTLPRAFTALARPRYHLPLGATAALAITFISLRNEPAMPVSSITRTPVVATKLAPAATAPAELATSVGPVTADTATTDEVSRADLASTSVRNDATVTASTAATHNLPHMVALFDQTDRVSTPSGRSIANNLAAARAIEPTISRTLLGTVSDSKVANTRGATVEPLSQMTPPSEMRAARFRTAMAVPTSVAYARNGERLPRDLSDNRLSEEAIRRLTAKANSFSVKF